MRKLRPIKQDLPHDNKIILESTRPRLHISKGEKDVFKGVDITESNLNSFLRIMI